MPRVTDHTRTEKIDSDSIFIFGSPPSRARNRYDTMYVKEGAKVPMPKLSKVTHLGIRQVPGKRARAEKGLLTK